MLIAILVVLTVVVWAGYVLVYFWGDVYGWFDNRWGPQSRPVKHKHKRRLYD